MTSIIEKIRHLLALADEAGGGTEAERLNAAEKAQALMFKHHLNQAAVDAHRSPQDVTVHAETIEGQANQWRASLLYGIANACGCDGWGIPHSRNLSSINVVGTQDNIDLVLAIYRPLVPWLETEASTAYGEALATHDPYWDGEAPKPKSFKRAFFAAAAGRISGRLREKRRSMEHEAGETGHALVLNEHAANEAWIANQGITLSKSRARSYGSAHGASAGTKAANRASLAAGTVNKSTVRGELN